MHIIKLKGEGASPYKIEGNAIVINSIDDLYKIKEGDIVILENSTPLIIPYLEKAGGFVAERVGLLSHICIVAREFKKPCVCGIPDARKKIKTGQKLKINGERGTVKVIGE